MKKYVIDTSSLVELMRTNPIDIYVSVWAQIEILINQGRLIAPILVLEEIRRIDDELKRWANRHKRMFRQPNKSQIKMVTEILTNFPGLSKSDKEGPVADPFVIALAREKNKKALEDFDLELEIIVVSEERIKGNHHKIPFACQKYNVKCIGIHEMFRGEGWKF